MDEAAFRSVSTWHSPVLDRVMPPLTHVASYSRLWMGVAAATAALGGPKGRLAAVAGLGTVALTSAVANLPLKGLTDRPRPAIEVPEARRVPQPTSSSFPSGHTASAAAFSGVVGHHLPALRLPLTALALAVGFSRVYTGAHYPGDVLAGWLLGRSLAGASNTLLDRRMAPRA